ncbi:hypothetical protein [Nocardia nepalensis]
MSAIPTPKRIQLYRRQDFRVVAHSRHPELGVTSLVMVRPII